MSESDPDVLESIAEVDLTIVDGVYVPAGDSDEVVVAEGEEYEHTATGKVADTSDDDGGRDLDGDQDDVEDEGIQDDRDQADGQPECNCDEMREQAREALKTADIGLVVTAEIQDDGDIDEASGVMVNHDRNAAELAGLVEILRSSVTQEVEQLPDLRDSTPSLGQLFGGDSDGMTIMPAAALAGSSGGAEAEAESEDDRGKRRMFE